MAEMLLTAEAILLRVSRTERGAFIYPETSTRLRPECVQIEFHVAKKVGQQFDFVDARFKTQLVHSEKVEISPFLQFVGSKTACLRSGEYQRTLEMGLGYRKPTRSRLLAPPGLQVSASSSIPADGGFEFEDGRTNWKARHDFRLP